MRRDAGAGPSAKTSTGARSIRPARVVSGLVAALAGLVATPTRAQDADPALAGFARAPGPAASAQRTAPVLPMEWSLRLATPNALGPLPLPLRPADAELLMAAREARWARCAELLKGDGKTPASRANAAARDETTGATVLPLAARAGQDDLVRTLLRQGAEIDRPGDNGLPALAAAALAGQRSTVRLLLRAGADATRWSASGQTALHLASVAGRLEVIDELLKSGVPVDLLNRQRETALDVAANANQMDAMDLLLKAGADTRMAGQR